MVPMIPTTLQHIMKKRYLYPHIAQARKTNSSSRAFSFTHKHSNRETGGAEESHSTDRTLMDLDNSHNIESVRYYRSEATGALELSPQTAVASRLSPRRT
jgi:hypothetical protein